MRDAAAPAATTGRTLRLTPAGAVTMWVALGVLGVWGAQPAVGLPAAAALAAVILNVAMARVACRNLDAGDAEPVTATAGDPAVQPLTLVCRGGLVSARDLILWHGRGARARVAGYVEEVAPGSRARVAFGFRPRRRGRFREVALDVSTSFPFGLAQARATFRLPADLLVLPRPGSVRRPARVAPHGGSVGARGSAPRDGDDELYGLREWREGESLRRVHWKLSARRGRPIVRELVSDRRALLHVALLLDVRSRGRGGGPAAFERAVTAAATLVEHFLRRGHRLRFSTVGEGGRSLPPGAGRTALVPILSLLAEVRPQRRRGAVAPPPAARPGEPVVFVTCGPPDDPAPHGVTVIDVLDPEVRDSFSAARPGDVRVPVGGAV